MSVDVPCPYTLTVESVVSYRTIGHVAELVYALRSGRSGRKAVEVQVLSCPQK
jgi:hypothetical protein